MGKKSLIGEYTMEARADKMIYRWLWKKELWEV